MTTPPGIGLRPFEPVDAAAAAELQAASMSRSWSSASWGELAAAPTAFGLVAESAGRMVGAVLARAGADEAEILMLVVAPDVRRRGIAAWLLDSILEEAARHGARRVFLEVGAANPAALALYRRTGFVDAGRRSGYYTPGDEGDALLLARDVG
jgi:[ribosomal protein S18]-alanine N-acetyltransferase